MRMAGRGVVLSLLSLGLAHLGAFGDAVEDSWPTWRGPNGDGIALRGDPPVTWSESENIKWKVELKGSSDSTPVVWGDRMFLTMAVPSVEEPETPQPADAPTGQRRRGPPRVPAPTVPYKFILICLDRQTGDVLWERTAQEQVPHEGHHPTSSLAAYSPVTDGERIWVSFGSRGLHCYDLDGNHQWSADLVKMTTRNGFGEGSSPAIAGDAVIVVADHEGDSKIFAFNKITGKLLWEKDRDEPTSWATPMPVTVGDSVQVVTSATNFIRSYDVNSGDVIWQCGGLTSNAIPSPVFGFGNVYCTTGHRGYALKCIKIDATGDVTDTDAVVWELEKGTPYVASPLLYDGRIYLTLGRQAILSCYEAKTGAPLFEEQKIEGLTQLYASPVGAAGRIYIAGRGGTVVVIKSADAYEVLASNTLDDGFDASPVVIGDNLYLKGEHHLYCIAEQ